MPFVRILVCLTVEEKDAAEVNEAMLALIDSFIVKHVPVFDSDVRTHGTEVRNAEEVRREIRSEIP